MLFVTINYNVSSVTIYVNNKPIESIRIIMFINSNDISKWFLFEEDWKGLTKELQIYMQDKDIVYVYEGEDDSFYENLQKYPKLFNFKAKRMFELANEHDEKGDTNEVQALYNMSAELGYLPAQLLLAEQAKQNFNKKDFYRWYYKAALQGDAQSQYEISRCYLLGWGVEKDEDLAFEWLKAAATQGHNRSQYQLGTYYKDGQNTRVNPKQAFIWYKRAAKQGYYSAQMDVAQCYQNGYGVEQNLEQAFNWYMKATEHNFGNAFLKVAECYEEGIGVEKDIQQLKYWLQRAVDFGNKDAIQKLESISTE
ncbi:MAG: hypothetical protein ATN31_08990 [Candidatus Epulonipiscioides saccharophilum]|nr:MAG: hypothetical protein ATN31_08990 [Epulopiscium sp. AS2M-Bin001]